MVWDKLRKFVESQLDGQRRELRRHPELIKEKAAAKALEGVLRKMTRLEQSESQNARKTEAHGEQSAAQAG